MLRRVRAFVEDEVLPVINDYWRTVCAEARDMLGGNGILLENHVIRHMMDITGVDAFARLRRNVSGIPEGIASEERILESLTLTAEPG